MKIALLKLSALGDIVHASIVLQFIKKHYPNSHITWIVDEKFSQILLHHELIDELITLPLKEKKYLVSYRKIRSLGRFDYIIDLQGLIKSALVCFFLKGESFGFSKISIREKFASFFYKNVHDIPYETNIILRNLLLVSKSLNFTFLEEQILNKKPCFTLLKGEKHGLLKKQLLFVTGSSWKSKMYPKELLTKCINELKEYDVFLCYGNDYEKDQAVFVAQNSHAKLLERLNLRQLTKTLDAFDLIIGPDSGVTHLAFVQNIPSLTLFGPTPYQRNTYQTPINQTLHVKNIDPKKLDKFDFCMKNLDPQLVAYKIRNMLEKF